MKILITGSDGFTGKYLHSIAQTVGHQTIALKANLNNYKELCDEVTTAKPDAIVHLAAISFVGHEELENFYTINVIGTENLLKATSLLKHKPRLLIASSANVYGNPLSEKISEDTPPFPVNHYAISKLAMEFATKAWFSELPIIITRPFNYTGVGQSDSFLIPKIVSHFTQKMKVIELGNLNVFRDFSDVRDIAQIYLQLLESDHHSLTVNICSGNAISLHEVIDILNKLSGYKIDVIVNPKFVRKNEIQMLQGDNALLKSLINLSTFTPIKDTIYEMYSSKYYL